METVLTRTSGHVAIYLFLLVDFQYVTCTHVGTHCSLLARFKFYHVGGARSADYVSMLTETSSHVRLIDV